MIFGPIACFRRLESRFSGQKGPRSSEMRVYLKAYASAADPFQVCRLFRWCDPRECDCFSRIRSDSLAFAGLGGLNGVP